VSEYSIKISVILHSLDAKPNQKNYDGKPDLKRCSPGRQMQFWITAEVETVFISGLVVMTPSNSIHKEQEKEIL
jgi:hypothetical protein